MTTKLIKKSLPQNYEQKYDIKNTKKFYLITAKFCTGKIVLDLGCGDGYGCSILARKSKFVDGVDSDSNNIRFAFRNFFTYNKTRFIHSELIEFLSNSSHYDLVIISDIRKWCKTRDEFRSLIELIPSPNIIIKFNREKFHHNNDYLNFLDANEYKYEIFDEQGNKTELTKTDIINSILVHNHRTIQQTQDKKKDLVSIIIPAYNSETTITETIESALNQSYSNIEIIVVDDGSNDNTAQICKKFNSKIKYYYKPNGGISSAFNYGIKKMSGTWFKWLSSDDLLTKDAVKNLMEEVERTGGLVIYSDYDLIDEKSNYLRTFSEPTYENYYKFASKIWIRYIGNASSILIHKSCFNVVGLFNEDLRFGEDYEWWQRACLVHGFRFFHVKMPIIKYRIHSKQTTEKIKTKAFENDQKIRQHTKDSILETDPEWWATLEKYQRIYNKEKTELRIRKALRHMVENMPSPIKNRIMAWRKKKRYQS